MAWLICIWTPRAIDKCAQHGISQDDYEHVILCSLEGQKSRTSDRYVREGFTPDGRWIRCVYDKDVSDETTIFPITAHLLEDF